MSPNDFTDILTTSRSKVLPECVAPGVGRVRVHALKEDVCVHLEVALSCRVNGLPFTTEQLNQVALMGPIYLPKHHLSHQRSGWEDGQMKE